MHHRAVTKLGTHDSRPVNIQCSCGTGGDFGSVEEAQGWMLQNHFRFLQGINTAEFADETTRPVPVAIDSKKVKKMNGKKKAKLDMSKAPTSFEEAMKRSAS